MRVLVTGSRQLLDQRRVYSELDLLWAEWYKDPNREDDEVFTVVHGAAPGADTIAGQWAFDMGTNGFPTRVAVEVHPAQWARFGQLAGGIRNGEMVRAGADIVLAFFQVGASNRGTRNCVNQAILYGLDVREMWID